MVTNKDKTPYLFCNILLNNFRNKEYFVATISSQNFSSRRFGNFTTLKYIIFLLLHLFLSPHSLIYNGNVLTGTESNVKVKKYNMKRSYLTNKQTKPPKVFNQTTDSNVFTFEIKKYNTMVHFPG